MMGITKNMTFEIVTGTRPEMIKTYPIIRLSDYSIGIKVKKLHAIWLFGIVASIGLTTMVSDNSVIAQDKKARSFMILPVK
jgi:hypothetical protein